MVLNVAFLATAAGVAFPKTGGFNFLDSMFAAGRASKKTRSDQGNGIDNYSGKDTVFQQGMHLIRETITHFPDAFHIFSCQQTA